jgi:hypothetical protein
LRSIVLSYHYASMSRSEDSFAHSLFHARGED